MSNETGVEAIVSGVIGAAKAEFEAERTTDVEQLTLLPTPEDMLLARGALGSKASNVEVLYQARRGVGRPPQARNKRTDDFARYILSFGQDPAITLMQIQSTPAEVLMEQSRKVKESRRTKDGRLITVTQTMSYEAAQALRKQCAAELMPYIHGKRPIAVDMSFSGVADLIIAGVTHSDDEIGEMLEGEYVEHDQERAA